jgi:hypothetical protein
LYDALPAPLPATPGAPRNGAPDARGRRGRLALWALILCGVLALVLFGSSAIFWGGLPGQHRPSTTEGRQRTSIPSAQKTATSSGRVVSTAPTALPSPSVRVGSLLYASVLPACDPQQKSLWSQTSGAQVTCTSSTLTLTNTSGGDSAGVFLKSLAGGAPLPDNYVLEVQVHVNPTSQGAFAIFFRAQSGANQKGAFSFLIDPAGNWAGNSYETVTGTPSELFGRKSQPLAAHGFTTLDIVVSGGSFSLYFDGVRQGGIESGNYPGGNLGLVAARGTEVQFKDMAMYTLPT